MAGLTRNYWRYPSSDGALVTCLLLLVASGALAFYAFKTHTLDQMLNLTAEPAAMVCAVASAGLAIAAVIWFLATLFNRARGVALVLDDDGLTDYRRGGGSLIRWQTIRSIDAEVQTINGSVQTANVILYVGANPAQLRTVEVRVGGLDRGPMEIIRQVKLMWMQATAPGALPP